MIYEYPEPKFKTQQAENLTHRQRFACLGLGQHPAHDFGIHQTAFTDTGFRKAGFQHFAQRPARHAQLQQRRLAADRIFPWRRLNETRQHAIDIIPQQDLAALAVTAQMVLGFSMALLVRRASKLSRSILTAIFLLPIVIPPIVIGAMWRLLLGRDFGIVNSLLAFLGLPLVDWLGDPRFALMSVIIVDVWHWTPFVFLLTLAGLESLDQEVFEAAKLDVINRWQELRYVTIPLMMPTLLITLAFRMILSFKVFDEVFLLTGGGPGTATEVINFSINRVFFAQDRVGMGSAMSLITILGVAVLIVLANTVARRRRKQRALI